MKKYFILLIIFITSLFADKNILVLHSYHHGLEWTDDISKGVIETLGKSKEKINLYFEYLDAKRNNDTSFFKKTHDYFQIKHKNSKFDLILVSDNKALMFMNRYKKEMFGSTPLVFCGINDFDKSMVDNLEYFTGVKESVAHKETIDLGKKLFPNKKYLLVILDDTLTAKKLENEVLKVDRSNLIPFKTKYYSQMNEKEIKDFLHKNKSQTVSYLLTYNVDRQGKFYSYKESIAYFRKLFGDEMPIIGSWSFFLNKGIVGGAITSGYKQGQEAANMILQIFDGKLIQDIKIQNSLKTIKIYGDVPIMEEFRISKNDFPAGTFFINAPTSIWIQYLNEILISSFFLLLLFMIFASAIYLKHEENWMLEETNKKLDEKVHTAIKQLKENEKIFKFIADYSQNVIFFIDNEMNLMYVNNKFHDFTSKEFSSENKQLSQYIDSFMYEILLKKLEKLSLRRVGSEEVFEYKDKLNDKIFRFFCFAKHDSENNLQGYKVVLEDMTNINEKIKKLTEAIKHDKLTNLYNKMHFDEMSEVLFQYAKKAKEPLCLIIFDIDHFKDINDTFGHLVGDVILKKVAFFLKQGVRKDDKVYRIGGEEFAILIKAPQNIAIQTSEKIRSSLADEIFDIDNNHLMITISSGVSSIYDNDRDFKTLFKRTDMALYTAKDSGRNKVCFA